MRERNEVQEKQVMLSRCWMRSPSRAVLGPSRPTPPVSVPRVPPVLCNVPLAWPGQLSWPRSPSLSCSFSPTEHGKLKSPWLWLSTAEQQPKQQCLVNVIPRANPKHSTEPATKKEINSNPAKTRTVLCFLNSRCAAECSRFCAGLFCVFQNLVME